jgi:hypothetical protein
MNKYIDKHNIIFIETEAEIKDKDIMEALTDFPFHSLENDVKGKIKLNLKLFKKILKQSIKEDEFIYLSFAGADKPLIIEIPNRLKGVIAPIVELDD